MTEDVFKYFAFISYSSLNTRWGKRLHKRLEHYRMPATLCSQHGWKRTPMRPVFFAPTDIQPGELSEELKSRLRASRNLIIICSPNSAQSVWVGEEIRYFHELGRKKNIHFFIVKGKPHSNDPATECLNPILQELNIPEILGSNIHEKYYRLHWLNKERAYVQLITKLLGVEFDDIWQRHKRQLVQKAAAWIGGCAIVVYALFAVKNAYQPFDLEIKVKDVSVFNEKLPCIHQIVVMVQTDDLFRSDTLSSFSENAIFKDVPHRFLGEETRICVTTLDANLQNAYVEIDTSLCLSKGIVLPIRRDASVYGHIFFHLVGAVAQQPLISIENFTVTPDLDGYCSVDIPLDQQQPKYHITASVPLSSDTVYMPCFEGNTFRVVEQ